MPTLSEHRMDTPPGNVLDRKRGLRFRPEAIGYTSGVFFSSATNFDENGEIDGRHESEIRAARSEFVIG